MHVEEVQGAVCIPSGMILSANMYLRYTLTTQSQSVMLLVTFLGSTLVISILLLEAQPHYAPSDV